ncbi:MAG: hypothetical protein ABII72_05010 [Parcubacteria group bacterium]
MSFLQKVFAVILAVAFVMLLTKMWERSKLMEYCSLSPECYPVDSQGNPSL